MAAVMAEQGGSVLRQGWAVAGQLAHLWERHRRVGRAAGRVEVEPGDACKGEGQGDVEVVQGRGHGVAHAHLAAP